MDAMEELRDVFMKVSVGLSGTMHLSEMTDGHRTLCGRLWWAENSHGATYCRTCQSILSKRVKELEAVLSDDLPFGGWAPNEADLDLFDPPKKIPTEIPTKKEEVKQNAND